jgi:hypothetical protein
MQAHTYHQICEHQITASPSCCIGIVNCCAFLKYRTTLSNKALRRNMETSAAFCRIQRSICSCQLSVDKDAHKTVHASSESGSLPIRLELLNSVMDLNLANLVHSRLCQQMAISPANDPTIITKVYFEQYVWCFFVSLALLRTGLSRCKKLAKH